MHSCKKKQVTLADLSDYINDLKKSGFSDMKKLQGLLDRAKTIAAKQGKENDIPTIIGIIQQFFKEEQKQY